MLVAAREEVGMKGVIAVVLVAAGLVTEFF
jgi:hypothetical protein